MRSPCPLRCSALGGVSDTRNATGTAARHPTSDVTRDGGKRSTPARGVAAHLCSALRGVPLALACAAGAGCTANVGALPDLAGIYRDAARGSDAHRNPVIVIPGILGSKLVDSESGAVVWGAFGGGAADPDRPDGARLVALPMADGEPLERLRDGVTPAGVLDRVRVRLFGLPVELQAYLYVLRTLGVGGYRDESLGRARAIDYGSDHFTCFQFAYDWRRDNVENARRLHAFILEKRAYVIGELRRRYGVHRPDLKFDIVAHSMGGLLTRYYLQYGTAELPADGSLPPLTWEGARYVERVALVATPNAGSVQALRQLVEGVRFSVLLPRYSPAVLGTMPAIYQLLPRARHGAVVEGSAANGPRLDPTDPSVWRRFRWGLADPAEDAVLARLLPDVSDPVRRRAIALDHLDKALARARRLHAALDRPAPLPTGLTLRLFAGDAHPTAAVLGVDPAGVPRVVGHAPGDGTVLRSSAVLDERVGRAWTPGLASPIDWSGVTFLFSDHLALTRDPAFTDNVLFHLLDMP